MEIKTKFSLGDSVHKIWRCQEEKRVECPACDNGWIRLKDGSKDFCPRCNGKGNSIEYKPLAWAVQGKLTVGQIRVEVERRKQKEVYMCRETGVGSGVVHPVNTLFETHAEALKACKELNAADTQLQNYVDQ
jgi:hypothetical protein